MYNIRQTIYNFSRGTSNIYSIKIFWIFPLSSPDFYLFKLSGFQIYMVAEFAKCYLMFLQWDFKNTMFKPGLCILFIILLILWCWYLRNILKKIWSVFNLQSQPSWRTLLWASKHRGSLKTSSFPSLGNRDVTVMVFFFLTRMSLWQRYLKIQ